MNIPCPKKIDCECPENPLSNYSEEEPDNGFKCATAFFSAPLPLGWNESSEECESNAVTQAKATCCAETIGDAQLCAYNLAQDAVYTSWVDQNCNPQTVYCNEEQSATSLCADGSPFKFTVPACTYYSQTVADANAIALSIAQNNANSGKFCCLATDIVCCNNTAVLELLTVSSGTGPFSWTVESGGLPAGVVVTSADTDNRNMIVSGTPTVAGSYGIVFRITDTAGSYLTKTLLVNVIEISPTTLADANVGVAYSQQLTATGLPVGSTASFAVTAGSLPDGLTLTSAGLLSGTPTTAGTDTFTISVTVT